MPKRTELASYPSEKLLVGGGTTFAANPDLSLAAYGLAGGRIRIIDLRDGQKLWTSVASKEQIVALAFSPDGKILASCAGFSESDIRLWDVATGAEIGRLEGHGSWVSSLAFWPDGKKLASSSADQTLRIWDVASRKCLDILRGHRQEVWRLALLPDAKTLVSGAKDGTVCFWDTSVTHPRQPYITIPDNCVTWCFTPDSRSVLTLNEQGQVSRWSGSDFQNKEPLLEIEMNEMNLYYAGACFSQDGRFLTTGSSNGVIRIWDVSRRILLHQLTNKTGWEYPKLFLADGNTLIVWSLRDNRLHEWDLTTGLEMQSWQGPISFYGDAIIVSPDELSCVAIGEEGDFVFRNLADETSAKLDLGVLETHAASYSPDGKLLAIATIMGYARIWDTATWRQVATLGGFLNAAITAGFSPDGRRLAIGSAGKEALKLWDTDSWQEVLTLESQGTMHLGGGFSPDGNTIVWGNWTALHLWRAPSWAEINAAEKVQSQNTQKP